MWARDPAGGARERRSWRPERPYPGRPRACARALAFDFFPKLIVEEVGEVEGRRRVRSRKREACRARDASLRWIDSGSRPEPGSSAAARESPAAAAAARPGRCLYERERIRGRRVPREELEQQDPDGVHVRVPAHRPAPPLLLGDVGSDLAREPRPRDRGRTPVASPNPARRISPSSEIATNPGHTSPWSVRSPSIVVL